MTIPSLPIALAQATRTDFSLFLRRVVATTSPAARYAHNWHIDAISEYLGACARGEVRRLIINLPPRMLKSTLVSVAWPAWLLGQDARARMMVASYAQSLATKHSTDCRLVMQSAWYRRAFPDTRLSADQNEKDKFVTTARGQRLAVSVGGAAIGEGGNILIVDDPLNPLQAMQRSQRESTNAWFDHSFATRLDDKQRGAMVVVMQRLHAEDLSGYLLRKGGWEHLCLPAIAPEAASVTVGRFHYARAAGEALHPAREPEPVLRALQQEMGSTHFSAQYQQAPRMDEGAMVKSAWLARYVQVPQGRVVQSWDTAIKAGAQHDASACATFVRHEGVHYLVDLLQVRLEYPELKRLMVTHAARFQPEVMLIEDKASGQSLLQDLRRETELPVLACLPQGDKQMRLARVTPLMEAGRLALPHAAPWLAEAEMQLLQFPDYPHDDAVDAISQYLNWVRARAGNGAPVIRRV
jgi:predicted phage terminase large subunit-like protein